MQLLRIFANKNMKKLNNNEIKAIGFKEEYLVKMAGGVARRLFKEHEQLRGKKVPIYALLKQVLENPSQFEQDEYFAALAKEVIFLQQQKELTPVAQQYDLLDKSLAYEIYGGEAIEPIALNQMNMAMRLPISVAGALMPDAHPGYGLPIGGVLATTHNTVIPYAVGVDIACRMCLSIFDIESAYYIEQRPQQLKNWLKDNTVFGIDGSFKQPLPDDLFDSAAWNETKFLKNLKEKAMRQVGTSGTGNHFVEFGSLELSASSPEIPLPSGKYLALLSHSGSRGFGATIANHYSKLAMEISKLPKEAQHLAWLALDQEEGQEYWFAMNLAGEYASANHHHIHKRMATSLGINPVLMIENHHNFAWKEQLADGTAIIVHRKGATPANKGDLGIIPGTMASPAFVVKGRGNPKAINSASHGAGRVMSRSKAMHSITQSEVKKLLQDKGVLLIGGDLDEAPMVYKDINQVMQHQQSLVEILATFHPKVVRMADANKREARED
jgi:tRNA-splicing ligase RtcB (3'-phosphate/5'-hydroxy nucleic acid ligase)